MWACKVESEHKRAQMGGQSATASESQRRMSKGRREHGEAGTACCAAGEATGEATSEAAGEAASEAAGEAAGKAVGEAGAARAAAS